MKIANFLLITLLFIFSYGCSDEQPYEPEKQDFSVWAGEKFHFNIETDIAHGNYALTSANQEIATATLDDNQTGINVITYKRGKTIIQLIDTDNNKIVCEISISVKYFSSPEIIDWGIPPESSSDYPGIIIKATDLRIPPKIEEELREEVKLFIGTTYTFNQKTMRFTMKTDSGISYEGTYEWSLTSLTLMCNNKIEKYGFKFATGIMHGYIIQADKTQKYQLQYPDAGITEVKVNHVWQDNGIIPSGGIIF